MASLLPRDVVLTAFAHQEPGRVPVDYDANPGIDGRLKKYFGLSNDDDEGLRQALGVDFRKVEPVYTGRKLHADDPDRGVVADHWGIRRKWIEHESGGYWDYVDFPLKDATEDEVAVWPMPSPDDFDYKSMADQCRKYNAFAIYTGGPGLCDIINKNGMLRGVEETLVDLITSNPAGLLLAKRRVEIGLEITRRTLEAAKGCIDFVFIGEDLGTQTGPLISPDLYRRLIRPHHQRFVDLAGSFGLPVMIHSCGSSSWAFGDFIEMGIAAVDTLQPEAKDMAPAYLKKTFGSRLAFHGCITTGGSTAFGTPEEVIRDCRKTLEIMMPGGGYCFAPAHQLQDNTPTENVLALYETAEKYGKYGP
jgi:uroporphyrinogen decarboxylase